MCFRPGPPHWRNPERKLVERFFNRINPFRGLSMRRDTRPENDPGAAKRVAAGLWYKSL